MKICPMSRKCCYGHINGEECAYNLNMAQDDPCPQDIEEWEMWEIAEDKQVPVEEKEWY